MALVTDRDYRAILAVVAEAARGNAATPLPPAALEATRRLFPWADSAAYFEGAPWSHDRRVWVSGNHAPWTAFEREVVDRFRHQVPLWPGPTTLDRPLRVSDFMSRRAYRSLDLYVMAGRAHGIEYSMGWWTRPRDGIVRGFGIDASARDFSDRDLAVLDVLGTYLGRVLSIHDPRLPDTPAPHRLTARQRDILGWVARGRSNAEIAAILSLSPGTVRKHLENAYERLGVHSRAAAVHAGYGGPESA